MSSRAQQVRTRADFHVASGVLLITREPPPAPPATPGQPAVVAGNPMEGVEILLAVWDDGSVTALHGHVDLGQGIATALAQIVAEELDVPMAQVHMLLGHTASVPNQGATIASASIQIHAVPLRAAAAQAKQWLERAQHSAAENAGPIQFNGNPGGNTANNSSRFSVLRQQHVVLSLDLQTPTKPAADYTVVGTAQQRVDIPGKVTGELTFVHDMRLPDMLHGRVVRPPYAGLDTGEFVGNLLDKVDEASIAHIPGIVAVVVIRDFIGIVAEREEQAQRAMHELKVHWKAWPGLPDFANAMHNADVAGAIKNNPSQRRLLLEQGQVDAALQADGVQPMPREYVWPYQLHASIGPSCALASWHAMGDHADADGPAAVQVTVWAGTQNPHVLRADLAQLTGLPDTAVDVIRMEAAGCYGRNCADDVAADAVLLSRAVGKPVRVQLSREQEHAWEPKGAAQLMQINGGLNLDGSPAAYDFQTSYPSNGAPTLALLLTRTIEPLATAYEMGDRTAVPPYDYANLRVAANDMAPILRASWLRGVSALPNSFAHESYIDELAVAAGVDPVQYRLRHLKDPRAIELVKATAEKAQWHSNRQANAQVMQAGKEADTLKGQGFAYARYIHSKYPGFGAAWAAWVADVEVNRHTGEVHVSRVVVGHDAGLMVNPAGVQHQIHGNVLQTTSRALKEEVKVDGKGAVANREWGSYPILSFREVPVVEVMMMPRPGEAPLGAGESSSVPGTAAIANAIFDATGVRLRQPPFTPEVVKAALDAATGTRQLPDSTSSESAESAPRAEVMRAEAGASIRWPAHVRWPRAKRWTAVAGALGLAALGITASLLGLRTATAPIRTLERLPNIARTYSQDTIERGRQLAAAGDCVVCHTAPGGIPNAGGRAMETPFGTIYTTNLTPDLETGMGRWSLEAFTRAMREGISRDGKHLYPAFPYTAFTKMTDEDLTALYAYLMVQEPVAAQVPETKLAFPYSVRPLLAAWNAAYLEVGPVAMQPGRSAEWNRGAYLVNGVGHCGACHTPRNAAGAEKTGAAYLSGAMVDGWEAPALTSLTHAPVPWTAQELYRYLRTGHTAQHGVAAGPMAPVVRELMALPDEDIRAMAVYLASFNADVDANTKEDIKPEKFEERKQAVVLASQQQSTGNSGTLQSSKRLFVSACGACHHDGNGPVELGQNLSLALNSNLHSSHPDNLLRVILEGIQEPATPEHGFMPAFKNSLDDQQVAQLAAYLRQRYASDKPAWSGLQDSVARLRATLSH